MIVVVLKGCALAAGLFLSLAGMAWAFENAEELEDGWEKRVRADGLVFLTGAALLWIGLP